MEKSMILKTKDYLKLKYNCHSIILYGSFVNETYTKESDIDIICFADNIINTQNDMSIIDGWQLDTWIYNTDMIEHPENLLHIDNGRIILDERNLCKSLLININQLLSQPIKKLTMEEINFQKEWLKKMLNRSRKKDVEGNFRYHWMLVDSLEIYFDIRGLRYMGPKKSVLWLKDNDKNAYKLFENALKNKSTCEETQELIDFIINLDPK